MNGLSFLSVRADNERRQTRKTVDERVEMKNPQPFNCYAACDDQVDKGGAA